ncbi:MAG: glycosyltransferase family 2 protein [Chloroflexi bacterium]|nr:glycosyltransferase family 2 protein [Chloroflexota bacterium]
MVIPAFNEERRLPATLERIREFVRGQGYGAEIVIVNDGSTDGTAAGVGRYADGSPPVRLVQAPHRGKGHAVKLGMLAATGRYRFLCDADLAMPIEELPRFLPPQLDGVDIAIGSREAPGARRYDEPWPRHLMGRGFNGVVRLFTVRGIRDTQCGFKCFRGEVASALFAQQRLDGFGFDVEILFLAQRAGLRMVEVPIDWHHSRESKVQAGRDTFRMLRDTLGVRWNWMRGRYDLSPIRPSSAAPVSGEPSKEHHA